MFFSIITKKLNWEILSKNSVAFKRWNGVLDEKFYYYAGLPKLIFREFHEKTIKRRNCLKRGAWTACRFKRGLDKK